MKRQWSFLALLLVPALTQARPEGTRDFGMAFALESGSWVEVDLNDGDILYVCSSDDGKPTRTIVDGATTYTLDSNTATVTHANDELFQNWPEDNGRRGAEILLLPPVERLCTANGQCNATCGSDSDCARIGEYNNTLRGTYCHDEISGLPIVAMQDKSHGRCMKRFSNQPDIVGQTPGVCNSPGHAGFHRMTLPANTDKSLSGVWKINFVGEKETITEPAELKEALSGKRSTRFFDINVTKGSTYLNEGRIHMKEWPLLSHAAQSTQIQPLSTEFYASAQVPLVTTEPESSNSSSDLNSGATAPTSECAVFQIELENAIAMSHRLLASRMSVDNDESIKRASLCRYYKAEPANSQIEFVPQCFATQSQCIVQDQNGSNTNICAPEPTWHGDYDIYLNAPVCTPAANRPEIQPNQEKRPLLTVNFEGNDDAGDYSISPNNDGMQDTITFSVQAETDGTAELIIHTSDSNILPPVSYNILKDRSFVFKISKGKKSEVVWDGKDINGDYVPVGFYPVKLSIYPSEIHYPTFADPNTTRVTSKDPQAWPKTKVTISQLLPTSLSITHKWNDSLLKDVWQGGAAPGDSEEEKNNFENGLTSSQLADILSPSQSEGQDPYSRSWPPFLYNSSSNTVSISGENTIYPIVHDTWISGNTDHIYTTSTFNCRSCGTEKPTGVRVRCPGDGNTTNCEDAAPDSDRDGLPDHLETTCMLDDSATTFAYQGMINNHGTSTTKWSVTPGHCLVVNGKSYTCKELEDTDGDGIPDGLEDRNHNGKVDKNESDPCKVDSDGDGIPDGEEDYGDAFEYNQNSKSDGICNARETCAYSRDSDGDGIPDNFETEADLNGDYRTSPKDMDSDGDGLLDGEEDSDLNGKLGPGETDPSKWDSDGDGIPDGIEVNGIIENETCQGGRVCSNYGVCSHQKSKILYLGDMKSVAKERPTQLKTADGKDTYYCVCSNRSDWLNSEDIPVTNSCIEHNRNHNATDPLNPDSDGDGIPDGLEDRNRNGIYEPELGETDPNNTDSDGDGIPDGVEDVNHNGICDRAPDGTYIETCAYLKDTDGDGLEDGIEDANHNGRYERELGETDPRNPDTDGDGIPDGIEDCNHNGKYDEDSFCRTINCKETNPLDDDSDHDGLLDGEEDLNRNGCFDSALGETDPRNIDTDGGGENDFSERQAGRNPTNNSNDDVIEQQDADGDGIPDYIEQNSTEFSCLDPNNPDSDGDGILDGVEDKNHNGRRDFDETDPCKKDTDGDGIPDGVEDENHNGIRDENETDPRKSDTDNDGLSDSEELKLGTDPLNPDTDDDGLLDGLELLPACRNWSPTGVSSDFSVKLFEENIVYSTVSQAYFTPIDYEKLKNKPFCSDPLNPDTDGDGILDGAEDANHNGLWDQANESHPRATDTDGDGLNDGEEDKNKDGICNKSSLLEPETCTYDPDTDHGGENDKSELDRGSNPLDPSDDQKLDSDHDGIPDEVEERLCTDPYSPDSDGDGILDGVEYNYLTGRQFSNPCSNDTDGDGLLDGEEDKNHNGIRDKAEDGTWLETDIAASDSDDDGMNDNFEINFTKYKYSYINKYLNPGQTYDPTAQHTSCTCNNGICHTSPLEYDSDGDGLSDTEEDKNKNGKIDDGETDPCNPDTDLDGILDGSDPEPLVKKIVRNDAGIEPTDLSGRDASDCSSVNGRSTPWFLLPFLALGLRRRRK